MTVENIVPLFKHRKKNIKVVGQSNRTYSFINHQYFTANPKEIAELKKLADSGECGIYIDPNEASIDTNAASPMAKLEKTMREQILAELVADGRLLEASTSDQSRDTTKVTSTADSTLNANTAAEQKAAEQLRADAAKRAEANPALAALNALKAGQNQQDTKTS